MLIDTHCHLTDERLAGQIDEVLSRAKARGVTKIIAPSTSLEDARKLVEIAGRYDEVFGLVGVHPENISELRIKNYELCEELKRLVLGNRKVMGIGEIGLENFTKTQKLPPAEASALQHLRAGKNFWRSQISLRKTKIQNNMELQKIILKVQLELAVELDLPVTIHMREAENEMIEVLQNMKELPAGQFHCWAGSESFLKMVLDLGFYVSFCGNITFKSAMNLRELIKIVPLDKLLLETDSPYLSPEPKRGGLNEPANVTILAEYIANLLNLPIETLINQTTANAKCLYFGG